MSGFSTDKNVWQCPQCGKQCALSYDNCPNCGCNLTLYGKIVVANNYVVPPNGEPSSKLWLAIPATAISLAIMAGIALRTAQQNRDIVPVSTGTHASSGYSQTSEATTVSTTLQTTAATQAATETTIPQPVTETTLPLPDPTTPKPTVPPTLPQPQPTTPKPTLPQPTVPGPVPTTPKPTIPQPTAPLPTLPLITMPTLPDPTTATQNDEDVYERAVKEYNNKNYSDARTLFETIPDYKDSEKYLRLLRIRNAGGNIGVGYDAYDPALGLTESDKKDIDEAARDFYFADTAEVLLCNSDVACYYLVGDWNGGPYCYIHFRMNDYGGTYKGIGSKLSTNYGHMSFSINDGVLHVDVVDTNALTLKMTLTGPDTMEVLTYEKGNKTYTLQR